MYDYFNIVISIVIVMFLKLLQSSGHLRD
jgi:hypothetical protein